MPFLLLLYHIERLPSTILSFSASDKPFGHLQIYVGTGLSWCSEEFHPE